MISPSILSSLKKSAECEKREKLGHVVVPPRSCLPPFLPCLLKQTSPHPSFEPCPPSFPPSSPDVLWALNKKTLFSLHQARPASKAREGEEKGKEEVGQTSLLSARLSNYFCVSITGFTHWGRKGRSFAIEDPPMSATWRSSRL